MTIMSCYDLHDRFGQVVTLVAVSPILPGEEITVNYNYSPAVAPPWYKEDKHTWSQLQSK